MDPSEIHDRSSPLYVLPEIWPFPMAGVGDQIEQISAFHQENGRGLSGGGARRRRDAVPAASEDESSKVASTSSGNEMMSDTKRLKGMGSREEFLDSRAEMEESSGNTDKPSQQRASSLKVPKQDYIHVRARRGQATDSHSLAERARREKISERMKILQDLVPGCNKVIGKALVLDEIINYVQSLQRQVEFLSMKLEAVNARMMSGVEGYSAKEIGLQMFDAAGVVFESQLAREFEQGSPSEWLHMQVGGGFERAT